ncbi:MAG: Na/Pi cotransporter family protein [Lachnospiraceae bacterium]
MLDKIQNKTNDNCMEAVMTLVDIGNLFTFVGGLGMFLYGMNIMADGMQKSAGGKLSKLINYITNNRFLGVVMGALITAIIQSSGATTVMVVGFVNAGMISLSQAVGVIMGANIGTTITAWIVSLSQIGDAMQAMKPAFYAPLLLGIGAVMLLFCKKERKITIGQILIGLGLLFMGLDFMSSGVSCYSDAPIFAKAFEVLGSNPFLGALVGIVVTCMLQSSSASVGILQTLAMNGLVTSSSAIYITLGQNIGSCCTALLSCIGANKTAKKAAVIHLIFNVIGSVLFGVIFFTLFMFKPMLGTRMTNTFEISIFHTMFNITNTLIMFPFANGLVKLSGLFIDRFSKPEEEDEDEHEDAHVEMLRRHLDERLLSTPFTSIENAINSIVFMAAAVRKNTVRVMELASGDVLNKKKLEKVFGREHNINQYEKMITEYLVKISNTSLSEEQHMLVNHLFYTVSDIERVGDHVENIAECVVRLNEHEVKMSELARGELEEMTQLVLSGFTLALKARSSGEIAYCDEVVEIEEQIDKMEKRLREEHIERLANGQCNTESGVVFLDIISNLERMSDHSMNIASYVRTEHC